MQSSFSDYHEERLEISNKENGKILRKLNDTHPMGQRNHKGNWKIEITENKNTTFQNLWATAKAVLRGNL